MFLEEWEICDGLFRYCFPSLTVVLLPIRQKEEGFKLLFVSMAALGNRPTLPSSDRQLVLSGFSSDKR